MSHRTEEARWRDLEFTADLPDVQELIREDIKSGMIRVRPKPGGGIRIVPIGIEEKEEPVADPPRPISRSADPNQESGFQGSVRTQLTAP